MTVQTYNVVRRNLCENPRAEENADGWWSTGRYELAIQRLPAGSVPAVLPEGASYCFFADAAPNGRITFSDDYSLPDGIVGGDWMTVASIASLPTPILRNVAYGSVSSLSAVERNRVIPSWSMTNRLQPVRSSTTKPSSSCKRPVSTVCDSCSSR